MERSWRKTKLEVFNLAWRESTLSYRKALKTARSDYFSSLLEQNKHNPRYLFNTVAKLTKNKASTGVDISQQHSSNDFMNYFTSKIDTIRDQIVTMQPSAILSHQIVYYRSPEEQFHSFSTHSHSHITLQPKTGCPLKLSRVEPGQYLDGRPPGKTRLLLEEVLVRPAGGAHPVVCVGPNAPV